MRNASAGLIALLNGNTEFIIAECLTLVRADGTVHRFTSAAADVIVTSQYDNASHTFAAGGVTFIRGRIPLRVGLQADPMDLTLLADPTRDTVTVGGVAHTWPDFARLGYLDGSRFLLERAFTITPGSFTVGTVILFSGVLGEMTIGRTSIVTQIIPDLDLLRLPMPRNVYQPGCLHTLYDTGCTLVRASFTVTGTAAALSTASQIVLAVAGTNGYYELGAITMTSGPNTGVARMVKTHTAGVVTLARPFPSSDTVGRTYSIYPGCDKQQATCSTKFSNLAHFRGYPYIPTPENAK